MWDCSGFKTALRPHQHPSPQKNLNNNKKTRKHNPKTKRIRLTHPGPDKSGVAAWEGAGRELGAGGGERGSTRVCFSPQYDCGT